MREWKISTGGGGGGEPGEYSKRDAIIHAQQFLAKVRRVQVPTCFTAGYENRRITSHLDATTK